MAGRFSGWLVGFVLLITALARAQSESATLKAVFEQPGEPLSAPIPAIATYVDPHWKLLFVQDASTGCLIQWDKPDLELSPGDQITIDRYRIDTVSTNPIHLLRDVSLRKLGGGLPPPAVKAYGTNLASPELASRWVELSGSVRSIQELGRLRLLLDVEGTPVLVWVRRHSEGDLGRLLDAEITVQGAFIQQRDVDELPMRYVMMVEDVTAIRRNRPGPEDPYALARTPVRQVAALAGTWHGGRLLLRGQILEQSRGSFVTIQDDTGTLRVHSPLQITLTKGETVEAIGFPAMEQGLPVLKDAQFRVVASSGSPGHEMLAAPANKDLPFLTTIKQVLDLPREEARKQYPLRVKGVVSFYSPPETMLFIQDGESGIFVSLLERPFAGRGGELVEIVGVTEPGGVLNMISPAQITVLGPHPMPEAIAVSYQAAMAGLFDSRRIKARGVVQSTSWSDNYLHLDLVVADGRFWCVIPAPDEASGKSLVNSYVEAEGVCLLILDRLQSPVNAELRVQSLQDIRVLQDAPADAFSVHPVSISQARGFIPPPKGIHRVKIRGIVTFRSSGRELYVQDSSGAICAKTDQTDPVEPGDEVEVIGFRSVEETGMLLRSAEYEVVGKAKTLPATPLRASEVLDLEHRDRLVRVEGRLLNDIQSAAAPELALTDGRDFFTARLEPLESGRRWPAWDAQTRLRITGICLLRLDESHEPRAFRLLVSDPSDITVLERPPWFTMRRVFGLAVVLLIVVMASTGWIFALRARVARQTELIRQRLESEAAAEKRLALVWESSADGMRLTDSEGVVVQVNQAYCELAGKSREELEGKSYLDAFAVADPEGKLAGYRERFANHVVIPRREVKTVLHSGKVAWLDITERFIDQARGNPLLLSQLRDTTEARLAEEERTRLKEDLLQAQKNESIGRLAGGVAHDFNNMLQVILGNASLAIEEAPQGSPIREAILEIRRSAERSAELTAQLLGFARKQAISPRVLDFNETIGSMLKMVRRLIGESIELIWVPGANLWPVKIDPAQVHQVLMNLCVNARDAIGQNGKIQIQTANVHTDAAFTQDHPDCPAGDYVLLSVTDTGHGIEAELMKHIFEPFFTTKAIGKGTGLGLATVFGIVKQNHGAITVGSEPGRGAAFRIYLPRSAESSAPDSDTAIPAPPRGSGTILLVEDEAQILQLAARILSQHGYQVLSAPSPEAALRIAREYPETIDLLITDVMMPGMNGKELSAGISAIRPKIRCLFISGFNSDVIVEDGVLEQGIEFLQKPFSASSLRQKVSEVMQSRA
jgi:PAS domain S-box-containing protein